MIGVKVAGKFLKLYPNTRIKLKLQSPLFMKSGKIPGIYSYPFTVPDDQLGYNADLLGIANIIENADLVVGAELPATIYFDGAPLDVGIVKIEPSEFGDISMTFFAGLRSVSEDFKDIKLKNLNWTTTPLHGIDYGKPSQAEVATEAIAQSIIDTSTASINIALLNNKFKLHAFTNPSFSSEKGYIGMVNYINSSQQTFANRKIVKKSYRWTTNITILTNTLGGHPAYSGTISLVIDGVTHSHTLVSIPHTGIYLFYSKIAESINNIDGKETVWAEARYSENLSQTSPNDFLLDIYFYIDVDTLITDSHDRLTITSDWEEYTEDQSIEYSNRYWYSPTIKVSDIFDKISDQFSIKFAGAFFDDSELQELYIYTNKSLNLPIKVINGDAGVEGQSIYGFINSYSPGEYMPDWSIAQFIREIAFLFNLGVIYSSTSQTIRFIYKSDVIKSKVYYDANKEGVIFKKKNILPAHSTGFVLKYEEKNIVTPFLSLNKNEKVIKTGKTPLVSKFILSDVILNRSLFIFDATQIKIFFNEEESLTDPVLFFDRGVNAQQHYALPFNTTRQLYWNDFDESNTIYTTYHKEWLTFLLKRKQVNITAMLQMRHLTLIRWEEKVMYDRVKYLYKSIEVTLTMKGVLPASVELYKT